MDIRELQRIALFEDATDDELQWLLDHCREERLEAGAYFLQEGQRRDDFYVVLEGELQITRTLDGTATVLGTTPRGIIGGEQNLLFGTPSLTTAQAILPSRLLVLGLPAFRAMFGTCPTVGAKVLKIAAERAAGVATLVKQQEKMAALGKLSAGLAHELNNPAAAAQRAASTLRDLLPELQLRTLRLCRLGLDDHGLDALLALASTTASRERPTLSPLEQSDREEALSLWLEEQDVEDAWEIAPPLVCAGIASPDLSTLQEQLPAAGIGDALSWLQQAIEATSLLHTIDNGCARIAELVAAIKSYTYMDQAPLQEVDLHKGLESTLTVLGHKLKGLNIVRAYDPEMPRILARGGELNQVWTNLIDNAIDALNGKGTIQLITRCENDFAMVEVADDGPGIAPEVLPRIFEPFFTTKGVGKGTGLGLDTSYRIIQQHKGSIEVQSQPGQTRFIVRLPVS